MSASLVELYSNIRENLPENLQVEKSSDLLKEIYHQTRSIPWDSFFSEDVRNDGKLLDTCNRLKEAGTKFFQKNLFHESVQCYNSYLRICHSLSSGTKEKKSLIFQGYSNRSTILFKAEQYHYCSEDVRAALNHSESDSNKEYLLWDRLAKCQMNLGKLNDAFSTFEVALKQLNVADQVSKDLKEVLKMQINSNKMKIKEQSLPEEKTTSKTRIRIENHHPDHPSLSSKTKVAYSPDKGRYVVAAEAIAPGELIGVDVPNVSFTHFDLVSDTSKACHNCVEKFHSEPFIIYPSPFIDGIAFCSYRCLKVACESYHKHELYIWKDYIRKIRADKEEVEKSGCMFLALRAVARHGPSFFGDATRTYLKENPTFGLESTSDIGKDEIHLMNLHNLVNHESVLPSEEKIRAAIRSVILVESLKKTGYFQGHSDPDGPLEGEYLLISELLYRFQLGTTFNVYLIYQVSGQLSGEIPLRMVGSAVYDDLVLLNHSCSTNITRFNQGGEMIIVAKRTIQKGEEISSNYGMHHNNQTCQQRQTTLLHSYKFKCECDACKKDFPNLANLPKSLHPKLQKQLDNLLSQYQSLFTSGSIEEAKRICAKYILKLEASGVAYPHRNFEMGAIALNSCWWGIIARE